MRVVTEALVRSDSAFHRGSSCASCRRTVPKTVYYADAPRKCSQCSRPLIEGEEGVMLEDALFHAVCLRRLVTDDAIRMSRHLSQRSRQLIEQSRRRTREARGAHGVRSAARAAPSVPCAHDLTAPRLSPSLIRDPHRKGFSYLALPGARRIVRTATYGGRDGTRCARSSRTLEVSRGETTRLGDRAAPATPRKEFGDGHRARLRRH